MSYKCWNLVPKNTQQKQAIKYLVDPDVSLVVLDGVAGGGKTLLALAAGLEQVLNKKQYSEILFTRAPVSVGEDLGFLPGDINEKMFPWCGGLFDNLEYLMHTSDMSKLQKDATHVFITNNIKFCAMQHMRGRSLYSKWVIIDEVQNISPNEIKVLLTRVGDGTKLVLMGDSTQIDNKKLSAENNGLESVISAYNHSLPDFIKHITLESGVRSKVATWGAMCL